MEKHKASAELYELGEQPFQLWVAPQRSIIAWTMTSRERFHLQINDFVYGTGAHYGVTEAEASNEPFVTHFDNMPPFRERFSDHADSIRQLLQETESCMKWKIAELPDLERWSSPSGRIILVGDAAHAFPP